MPAYRAFKLAHTLFHQPPHALDAAQTARLAEIAARQARIEAAVLASPEAAHVSIPPTELARRLETIQQRYTSPAEFLADLARNGLDTARLEAGLARELRLEAVLEQVAARAAPVTDTEAEIYYRLHPAAFTRPETRRLQHILITFDSPAEREQAARLLLSLRPQLRDADDFGAAARRHSHCPTALERGMLGHVKPGQLYAELDTIAFALTAGEISLPTESPVGLHLLRCDAILPGTTLSFGEARSRIIEHLSAQRRARQQRAWLTSLLKR
ncbi:MAG: nitrogen fixation protein NifM [Azovibrio sp.]|nr:nitrogen fixation protein NifM [Azovibrio sp.]